MKKPKYNIGDKVYHITPESNVGVVIDCTFSLRSNAWTYIVTFSPNEVSLVYYEDELSTNKTF